MPRLRSQKVHRRAQKPLPLTRQVEPTEITVQTVMSAGGRVKFKLDEVTLIIDGGVFADSDVYATFYRTGNVIFRLRDVDDEDLHKFERGSAKMKGAQYNLKLMAFTRAGDGGMSMTFRMFHHEPQP